MRILKEKFGLMALLAKQKLDDSIKARLLVGSILAVTFFLVLFFK